MLNNLLITSDVSVFLSDFLEGMLHEGKVSSEDRSFLRSELASLSEAKHLSFERWWSLLATFEERIAIPAIGIEIGKYVKVEHFGCFGYLLKTSKNLEEALRCFERFQRLLYDGNKATLQFEAGPSGAPHVFLVWQSDYGYSSQISDELLIASLMEMTRNTLLSHSDQSNELKPVRVGFTCSVPKEHIALYQAYFECDVRFGQKNLCVGFPADLFALPVKSRDENLHQLLDSQAQNLLAQAPDDVTDVMTKLHSVLVRCLHEGEPNADAVAKKLNMSTRTLHRKLKERDLIFRDILRETRMTLAKQYLSEDKVSLPEISLMLGYSEQSAFNRAFRNWFEVSPVRFKKQMGK